VYKNSIYNDGIVFQQNEFFAGSSIKGGLMLIFTLRADLLTFHVQSSSADLTSLKKMINNFFGQIARTLDKNDIIWKKPEATIYIENFQFYGYILSAEERFKAIFKEKWEELILVPIGSITASFLAIQFHILEKEEYVKDVKKALITTAEAYIGLVLIIIIRIFLKANKKEFNFTI
jgi:hypothetical protein